jgi:dolichol-phosphate mannosyltransferase
MLVSLISFIYTTVVLWRWWFMDARVPGWSSLIMSVLFLGGVQLMVLGVLGEYLWRVLEEARGRPLYILKARVGIFTPKQRIASQLAPMTQPVEMNSQVERREVA